MSPKRRTRLLAVLLVFGGHSLACSSGTAADQPALRALPGNAAYPVELAQRIAAALAAKGEDYRPRTRHLREDGTAEYTNRLVLETSPYLLQHAHNPVNWYPWGEEAFADAKRLGRPVLLSIGYSTCHWCHVMEEESFEDEEIAAYMNANYIAIKVDREERPDLDAIYMSAVQMLTGRGGWPMTTWLTPAGEPFFGGTYFPARDGNRGTRTGFLTLLQRMKQLYDEQPDEVAKKTGEIVARVRRSMNAARAGRVPEASTLDVALSTFRLSFDSIHGGRQRSPKFPSNLPVRLLLGQYRRTGEDALREMAELTLFKMAAGGIYDQVGGGFHRYSTDSKWLVPHFEKMLYDNALLVAAYVEGFQVSGREEFAAVARDVLTYVGREMTAPGGAFYSATDADSLGPHGEREEGWFFTWTPAELETVLGPDDARLVAAYYAVTAAGNFEGRSILHAPRSKGDVARRLGIPPEELEQALARSRGKLYEARSLRPPPLRDDKILTSWNGLMISAMARAGFVLDEPDFVDRARAAAQFLLDRSRKEGRLFRSYVDGQARHNAYLDDYSFLIAGLLDLFESTAEARWLREALALQDVLERRYRNPKGGGYFMTSDDHESLLAREMPIYDGAEPSGNSVALMNLLRLHELTTDDRFRASAQALLESLADTIRRSPAGVSELLLGLDFWLDTPKEIVIVTSGSVRQAGPFLDVLRETYLPNKVVAVVPGKGREQQALGQLMPLIQGKQARKGQATAYVCERGICLLPTTDVDVFTRQIGQRQTGTERVDTPN